MTPRRNSQPIAIATEMPISTIAPTISPCSPVAAPSFPPSFSPTIDISKLMSPNRVTAKQAEATYRTGRGQRILDFAGGTPAGWRIRTNAQLAYRFASIPQRVYLTRGLGLDEYARLAG
jgi:hypothetical protein